MSTRGQVKWFDPKKGYGFILGPENQDVFVHYTQIQGEGFRSLKDGEMVDYELIQGDKGWQARDVHPIAKPGGDDTPSDASNDSNASDDDANAAENADSDAS